MQSVIAKYPIKIGKVLVPAGTIGEVVDIKNIQEYFPNIKYKANSKQILVSFLGLKACIIHTSQVIINHD